MSDFHERGKGETPNPEGERDVRAVWRSILFPDAKPELIGEPLSLEQVVKDLSDSLEAAGLSCAITITSMPVGNCSTCRGTFDDLLLPEQLGEVNDPQTPAGEPPIAE
jgi:hypothetical protein